MPGECLHEHIKADGSILCLDVLHTDPGGILLHLFLCQCKRRIKLVIGGCDPKFISKFFQQVDHIGISAHKLMLRNTFPWVSTGGRDLDAAFDDWHMAILAYSFTRVR